MTADRDDGASRIIRRVVGALVAIGLLATVVALAGPAEVLRLLREADGRLVAAAVVTSAGFVALRGLRLKLLLEPGRITLVPACLVAAASQAAALFAPARTGELALPWLLSRTTDHSFSRAFGTLLAARALDLATLGVWCGISLVALRGLGEPVALALSLLLVVSGALLPWTLAAADWAALRTMAIRGSAGRRWTRRLRRVRTEVEALRSRPRRLLSAAAVSFAMWGLQWGVAWWLLAAMGHRWPPIQVAAGASAAAVANLLPFNLVGNLGTLEAGWTAAFHALGVPLQTAAATGLAAHLWGLLFAALFGALAWLALSFANRR